MKITANTATKITDVFDLVGEKFIGRDAIAREVVKVTRDAAGWWAVVKVTGTGVTGTMGEKITDPMNIRVLA